MLRDNMNKSKKKVDFIVLVIMQSKDMCVYEKF